MFILRVHSVDVDHPLAFEEATFSTVSTTTTQSNPIHNPKYSERRGVVHLYRNASQSSLPNPSSRSTSLFIVAVPNYLSADDFIRFCESHIDNVHELLFIRFQQNIYFLYFLSSFFPFFFWIFPRLRRTSKILGRWTWNVKSWIAGFMLF